MDSINRHIKVLELVRKECGELNYCGQLERIETLFNLEPDETNKYLLKYEIERLRLLIEKQKSKQAEGTEAYSLVLNKGKEDKQLTIERNGIRYSILRTKKNILCYNAIEHCVRENKSFDKLKSKDYEMIGVLTGTDKENVRSTLGGIMRGRLLGTEKNFFIELLIAFGITVGAVERFPFLKIEHASAI